MLKLDTEFIDSIIDKYGSDLKRINISKNGLRCIENIHQISLVLEKLNLSKNDISDVRPISKLYYLTELDLSENNISDITALSSCRQLQSLYLGGNCIERISSLNPLQLLPLLKTLSLAGNPICSDSAKVENTIDFVDIYPNNVFNLLLQVQTVDEWPRGFFEENMRNFIAGNNRNKTKALNN